MYNTNMDLKIKLLREDQKMLIKIIKIYIQIRLRRKNGKNRKFSKGFI